MTMRSKKLAAWAGAAAFALLAPLAHADLVSNGGFETGDLTGWTLSGDADPSATGVDPFAAHSGAFGAFSGSTLPGGSTLSQSVITVAGQGYVVKFWLSSDSAGAPPNDNSFSWTWNGALQAPSFSDVGSFGFTEFSAIVAGTGSDTLAFSFENPPSFWLFDDVSVEAPEPGTLALMGVAMLAGGVARRRKKLS